MGILDGKRILVTGVLTDASIAFHVARIAQQEGATVVLTGFGRLSLVQRIAQRLPRAAAGPGAGRDRRRASSPRWPSGCPSTSTAWTGWCTASATRRSPRWAATSCTRRGTDVATAVHVSTYSLKALAVAALPLMSAGGAIVGMDFDARAGLAGLRLDGRGQGRPGVLRPLPGPRPRARGIRVNLMSAGPLRTMAARSIPGFDELRRTCGSSGPRSAGTCPTPSPPRAAAWRCCRTGSRPRPARSCTWTAARTRSAADRRRPTRAARPECSRGARSGGSLARRAPPAHRIFRDADGHNGRPARLDGNMLPYS